MERHNFRAAESRFREALDYNPSDTKAIFELAQCLEKMNRPDDAVAEYNTCIDLEPAGPFAERSRKALERLSEQAAISKGDRQ